MIHPRVTRVYHPCGLWSRTCILLLSDYRDIIRDSTRACIRSGFESGIGNGIEVPWANEELTVCDLLTSFYSIGT